MNIDNISKLTDEGKETYKRLLDIDGGGGEQSSSFTTQIETTEGLTLGKGTPAEANIDPDTALKLKRFIMNQFKLFVASSASELDLENGVFISPNDNSIVNFLSLLDPGTNYSFIMTALDDLKIPFALEITSIDPISEDEVTSYNLLTVEMGRNITGAKIVFKSPYADTTRIVSYVVGILAVGM